jgi:plasmid stabilization system protein ParE
MKPVKINDAAEFDAVEATEWYLTHEGPEQAARFADAIERGFAQIESNPDCGVATERQTRSLILRPLQYRIIFREYDEYVEVFAVAHMRRSAYWVKRLRGK